MRNSTEAVISNDRAPRALPRRWGSQASGPRAHYNHPPPPASAPAAIGVRDRAGRQFRAHGTTDPLVRFPPGQSIFSHRRFDESLWADVDRLLAGGLCPDGQLRFETDNERLICLIHRRAPYLAGHQVGGSFFPVPLKRLPIEARRLPDASCALLRSDPTRVLMMALHFAKTPALQASTELVDLAHLLDLLEQEGEDAVLALERGGLKTLAFLRRGVPARVFFGNPNHDPGDADVRDRLLVHAYSPSGSACKIEVFKDLAMPQDEDIGTPLTKLVARLRPPPAVFVVVRLGATIMVQRLFRPPAMVVGRSPECDVILPNLSVSRRHARLLFDRGEFVIEDLGSANGLVVNGRQVTRCVIGPGDRIGLGKFLLSLAESRVAQDPESTLLLDSAAQGFSGYLIGKEAMVALNREITLGKAAGMDVEVRGFGVRPLHARIRPTGPATFELVCTPGCKIRVNDEKVQQAHLRYGDRLTLGRSRFVVVSSVVSTPL